MFNSLNIILPDETFDLWGNERLYEYLKFECLRKFYLNILCLQRKHHLMKELLSPIANKFEGLLKKLQVETNDKRQYAYAQSINMATSLAR